VKGLRQLLSEYREKKKRCKVEFGIYPRFTGRKERAEDERFAHRVAIRELVHGVPMVETETKAMTFLGWRRETEDEVIERMIASEVRLAKRQGVLKNRYFGDETQLIQDIRQAFLNGAQLDRPNWVKK